MKNFFLGYLPLRKSHLCLLLVLCLSVACQSTIDHDNNSDRQSHFLVVDTFRVPVLATPEDQLAYARGTFEEKEEKSAALQAIRTMHPTARLHIAMADLELAYLQLGADYRLADESLSAQAMEKYLAVLHNYPEFPEIAAKSLWYLGWIACDLRQNIDEGLKYFQKIIDMYPEEILNFLSPAPWLTIRPTNESKEHPPYYPKSALSWAAIAHLEIIRHTASQKKAWHSFSAIREKHGNDGFTGLALKTLITAHGLTGNTETEVRKYLAETTADKALRDDLHLALAKFLRDAQPEARAQ